MFPRLGGFVRGLLLAAEHHRDPAFGVEPDHHVRALVDGPDVVVAVDPDGVGERPGVKIAADLAQVLSVRIEFQQLRGRRAIGRSRRAAAREDEHMALGVDRDPGRLAEIHVGRKLEEVWRGVEGNGRGHFRRRLLRERGGAHHDKRKGDLTQSVLLPTSAAAHDRDCDCLIEGFSGSRVICRA